MAIRQGKVRFSRAALLKAVDEICAEASSMAGSGHPVEADISRDHYERVRLFLRRVIGERPLLGGAKGWTFELSVEQIFPCAHDKCNGIVVSTGKHREAGPSSDDIEVLLRCIRCQRKWWY